MTVSRVLARTVLLSLLVQPAIAQRRALPAPPGPDHQHHGTAGGELPSLERGDYRSVDGSGNNLSNPEWGSSDAPFQRAVRTAYSDGAHGPSGDDRPSARSISNVVSSQDRSRPNGKMLTDFFWQWGQFLDHDIDLTPTVAESFDIAVPTGDPWFDPRSTGTVVIPLERSFWVEMGGVRQQVNEITAFIDGSNVYGSDRARMRALRALDGTGRLKTSAGDLLPFNDAGLPNAPDASADYFLAGDFRANEQVGLTAMHTLFVREHNYWADRLREQFDTSDAGTPPGGGHPAGRRRNRDAVPHGDRIYQWARAIVVAEMQVITYQEFLPLLLGPGGLPPYQGYRADVDPSISNVFATAAYRFGHSMLSPELLRLDASGAPIPEGNLSLANAFFSPERLTDEGGIEPLLRGLAGQQAQELDPFVIDEVRNFLFGPPGSGGFDLASLNIQRGRDHGLPCYNDVRVDLGLPPVHDLDAISSDPEIAARLSAAYASIDEVDPWVGGLCEDRVPGRVVGRTFLRILRRQFSALRDGDRFWYESYLPSGLAERCESTTLAEIIRRNTTIGDELQDDVFHMAR